MHTTEDSLVVTHPTTNSPACGLSTAERTGSPVFHTLWSEDSLVVTHPTTNSPACGLSTAERTGSPIFHTLWSLDEEEEYTKCPKPQLFPSNQRNSRAAGVTRGEKLSENHLPPESYTDLPT
ncbi:hypothetical protein N7457_006825 [Penicillium paradoxum]|uniref:uncharacterized protein n=1 Tax=Penicillium paradoxum TaxID=176176 RepID=UPI002549094B|nr:uncharacterized protein N7457_006825 [Penicillium paradoxum]KAJ5779105.1 hypothetical protein N7457_006825 [Penicillium paradoxum]